MGLTWLERGLLRWIESVYETPWEKSDAAEIYTAQERPLPTRDLIQARFRDQTNQQIDAALERLLQLQYVAPVHLYTRDEFKEFPLTSGPTRRARNSNVRPTPNAFQITHHGKATVSAFFSKRLLRNLPGWIGGIVKDHRKELVVTVVTVATGVGSFTRFGCADKIQTGNANVQRPAAKKPSPATANQTAAPNTLDATRQ